MPLRPPSVHTQVVLRPFLAHGVQLERGEVVDVSTWVNAQPLINDRRITPASESLVPLESADGRKWKDQEALERHEAAVAEVTVGAKKTRAKKVEVRA